LYRTQAQDTAASLAAPQEVNAAASKWADAVALQRLDPVASFARASELGRLLAQMHGWIAAVQSLMERLSRH